MITATPIVAYPRLGIVPAALVALAVAPDVASGVAWTSEKIELPSFGQDGSFGLFPGCSCGAAWRATPMGHAPLPERADPARSTGASASVGRRCIL